MNKGTWLFLLFCLATWQVSKSKRVRINPSTRTHPTVAINAVVEGIRDPTQSPSCRKVLEGMLQDYIDYKYFKTTPYTMGERVLPAGCTIEDVDDAIANETTKYKFKVCFEKISEVEKSGDKTPYLDTDRRFKHQLSPIMVMIRPPSKDITDAFKMRNPVHIKLL